MDFSKWSISELIEPIHNGEWELKLFLRNNGYKVIDVSENPLYYYTGDLLVEENGQQWALEVKYDKQVEYTGNFFIEVENPRSKNGEGWFKFCKADFIFYGNGITGTFYCMRANDLRAYIEKNKDNLKLRSSHDDSRGYLLPIEEAPIMAVVGV